MIKTQLLSLVKNGSPVARLVSDHKKVCTGRDLADALARTQLSDDEAKAWHRDLQNARKALDDSM
jgi:hypothetical protein